MDDNKSGAQTVNRSCVMLKAVAAASPQGLRGSEIAAMMDLPRATAYRVLAALEGNGMIALNEAGRYVLGMDLFLMGLQAQDREGMRDAVRASLLRLSSATGDTAFLLLRHGFDAICVDRVDGNHPIQYPLKNVSERIVLGQLPGGMAILSVLPEAEQEEIIRHNLKFLPSPDEVALRCEMIETHRRGYALNLGTRMSDLGGIAVPVSNAAGRPIGAITIGGLVERFPANRIPVILQLLRQEVQTIGRKLHISEDSVPYFVSP